MAGVIESVVYLVDPQGNVGLPVSDERTWVLRPAVDGFDALAVSKLAEKYTHALVHILASNQKEEVIVPVGFPDVLFANRQAAIAAGNEINMVANSYRV